jgi:hypothetical protein
VSENDEKLMWENIVELRRRIEALESRKLDERLSNLENEEEQFKQWSERAVIKVTTK